VTFQTQELTWIWVFPKIGVPQIGWFIMENPIKMDDLRVPLFSETPICEILAKQILDRSGLWIVSWCLGFSGIENQGTHTKTVRRIPGTPMPALTSTVQKSLAIFVSHIVSLITQIHSMGFRASVDYPMFIQVNHLL